LIAAIILAVCALLLYKYWFAKKEFYWIMKEYFLTFVTNFEIERHI
jgi:uncharacterized membrane protein